MFSRVTWLTTLFFVFAATEAVFYVTRVPEYADESVLFIPDGDSIIPRFRFFDIVSDVLIGQRYRFE